MDMAAWPSPWHLLACVMLAAILLPLVKSLFYRTYVSLAAKGKPLPMPCKPHWLWGHLPLVVPVIQAGHHLDYLVTQLIAKKDVGKVFVLKLLLQDFVIVQEPEAIREVLIKKNYFKSPTYKSLHPFIGSRSMITSEGEEWGRRRAAFNPGFSYAFLKHMVPTFAIQAGVLVEVLRGVAAESRVVGMHEMLRRLTLDIICDVTLSENFCATTTWAAPNPLYDTFKALCDATVALSRSPLLSVGRWLPWNWYRMAVAQSRFDSMLRAVIRKRIKQQQQQQQQPAGRQADGAAAGGGRPHQDILGLTLSTCPSDSSSSLDMHDILSQIKTFLFAGHDTTATTVAFAIYEVSRHPGVEARLVEEVGAVFGGRPLGELAAEQPAQLAEDLNQLTYTTCVIKESLRMWPPGGTARMAPAGSTLQGYDIGRKVLYVPHYPLHRDPDIWGPDAHEFKPDRWSDEAVVAALHPCAYQPFSKGPRDCIGQTFAMLEAKVLLATLYSNFKFEYAGEKPEEQGFAITSHPKYGVPVRVRLRSKSV